MHLFLRLKSLVTMHIFWKYIQLYNRQHALVFLSSMLCALCFETKINCVNQNKGTITLKLFSCGRMCSAMCWRSGSFQLKTTANKRVKYHEHDESSNQSTLWWFTRYHDKWFCLRQKFYFNVLTKLKYNIFKLNLNVRGWVTLPTSWKVGLVSLGIHFLNA